LASFYGGISEEVMLRLFVMSLLAWLGSFISRTAEGKPTSAVFWISNILAAVLFGLGHLPATAMLIPLTPLGHHARHRVKRIGWRGVRLAVLETRT
jgi:membrane protease YdiL (CAAX protease family)